jgi:hypothetical protein
MTTEPCPGQCPSKLQFWISGWVPCQYLNQNSTSSYPSPTQTVSTPRKCTILTPFSLTPSCKKRSKQQTLDSFPRLVCSFCGFLTWRPSLTEALTPQLIFQPLHLSTHNSLGPGERPASPLWLRESLSSRTLMADCRKHMHSQRLSF